MPVSKLPGVSAAAVEAEHRREQIAQIRDYYAQLARIENVAFRLRTANVEFCKRVTARIGLHAATVRSLPRKFRSYSNEALGVSWTKPTVISVAAGSPAGLAGIRPGDQILRLDDTPLPPTGTQRFIEKVLHNNGMTPVRIAFRREGVDSTVTVTPLMACAIPVTLARDPSPNAYAAADKIVIQSGMLRLLPKDSDLAIIMGHELGHENLGHLDKQKINAVMGAVGGALIDGSLALGGIYTRGTFMRHFERAGALAYSVDFEREADYVGCYYAARAGYDIAGAEEIWRRMALELPDSIRFAHTHPTSPERFVLMRQTIAEIEDKQRRHLPLVPALKPAITVRAQPAAAASY